MAWSTPAVRATGDLITAAIWNQDVKDNTRYLKGLDGKVTIQNAMEWQQGANIASTGSMTVGTDGNLFHITGTTTITAFSTMTAGHMIMLVFDGALTLTYNATTLILQNAVNLKTVVGDVVILVSEGSGNWREVSRRLTTGDWARKGADIASATALVLGGDGDVFHVTGTTTITSIGTRPAGNEITLVFDGILTFTHNATTLILAGSVNLTTAAGDVITLISEGSGNWREKSVRLAAASGGATFTRFTATGTWTKGGSTKVVIVEVIGAGGGGGGGAGAAAGNNRGGGGGGGAGAIIRKVFDATQLGATETITIGAGGISGAGGSTANGVSGGAGVTSSFGSWLSSYGGGGGAGGAMNAFSNPGGGGGGTGGVGTTGAAASTVAVAGGNPEVQGATLGNRNGGSGGGGMSSIGGNAEYGGGGGAGGGTYAGGSSINGGGAGGGGANVTSGNGEGAGGAGGASNSYTGGGGGAGGAVNGGAGTVGAAGTGDNLGSGGGGGGSQDSGTGGVGGTGGAPGGGAGGGGAGTVIGGAGGVGARGEIRVWEF